MKFVDTGKVEWVSTTNNTWAVVALDHPSKRKIPPRLYAETDGSAVRGTKGKVYGTGDDGGAPYRFRTAVELFHNSRR